MILAGKKEELLRNNWKTFFRKRDEDAVRFLVIRQIYSFFCCISGGLKRKYPGKLLKGPDVFTAGTKEVPMLKGEACRKNWIKPLKGINLGVVQAFFTPKRSHSKTYRQIRALVIRCIECLIKGLNGGTSITLNT